MSSLNLRKLTLSLRQGTFLEGLRDGMSVTDYAFDPSLSKVRMSRASGLALDGEALRNDVRQAEAESAKKRSRHR